MSPLRWTTSVGTRIAGRISRMSTSVARRLIALAIAGLACLALVPRPPANELGVLGEARGEHFERKAMAPTFIDQLDSSRRLLRFWPPGIVLGPRALGVGPVHHERDHPVDVGGREQRAHRRSLACPGAARSTPAHRGPRSGPPSSRRGHPSTGSGPVPACRRRSRAQSGSGGPSHAGSAGTRATPPRARRTRGRKRDQGEHRPRRHRRPSGRDSRRRRSGARSRRGPFWDASTGVSLGQRSGETHGVADRLAGRGLSPHRRSSAQVKAWVGGRGMTPAGRTTACGCRAPPRIAVAKTPRVQGGDRRRSH